MNLECLKERIRRSIMKEKSSSFPSNLHKNSLNFEEILVIEANKIKGILTSTKKKI